MLVTWSGIQKNQMRINARWTNPWVALLCYLSTAVLLWISPISAVAQEEPPAESVEAQAEALAADARILYDGGQYAQAITAYVKAHRLSPAGALLYNIAFIYDQKLNERELAVDFYRRFIKSPDADPALMERANQRIAELKVESVAPVGTGAVAPIDDPAGGGGTPEGTITKAVVVAGEPGPRPLRTAGWVTGGVGLAALATGVVFGVLAQGTHDDFEGATTLTDKLDLSDTGEMQALTGDVLMGVGSAALVTGIILLIVDATQDSGGESANVSSSYRLGTSFVPGFGLTPIVTLGGSL